MAFSLAVSLIVALTLIPMLASRHFEPLDTGDSGAAGAAQPAPVRWISGLVYRGTVALARTLRLAWTSLGRVLAFLMRPALEGFDRGFRALAAAYDRSVAAVLVHPLRTVLVTLTLLAASLWLYPRLGRELVPELVQGEFFANVELPPGTRLEVTDKRLSDLDTFAAKLPGVRSVYTVAGTSNEQGGVAGETRENIGQVTVILAQPTSREREDSAMASLRSDSTARTRSCAAPTWPRRSATDR